MASKRRGEVAAEAVERRGRGERRGEKERCSVGLQRSATGLLEALWALGGERDPWKHPQRAVPWRESWDERASLWEKLGGVRAARGNQENCPSKRGFFFLVYVSLGRTKA